MERDKTGKHMKALGRWAAASAAWLFAAGASLQAAPAPKSAALIVPGQSIGQTHLGMSRRSVHALLRSPTLSRRVKRLTYDLWAGRTSADPYNAAEYRLTLRHHDYENAVYLAGRYVEVIYQGGKVVQIETNSPLFVTHDGISVGDHPNRVAAKYPPLHGSGYLYGPPNPDTGIGYNRYYEDSIKRGIAFVLETSPHASFSPEDTVTAIVVHSSGRPVIARPHGINPLPEDANPL